MEREYDPIQIVKLIGGGKYSNVFLLRNGNILKAIKTLEDCEEAEKEFAKQTKIYNCFNALNERNHKDHALLNLIKKYIIISRPIRYNNKPFTYNDEDYNCSIVMSELKGVPLSMIAKIDDNLQKNYDADYWSLLNLDQEEIMLHASFNNCRATNGVLGMKETELISESNPARGYFFSGCNNAEEWFETFIMEYNEFPLTMNNLEEIFGFIYGWIYYACHIIPLDIEMTIGLYNGEFKINVLDFGQTFDMKESKNNVVNDCNSVYDNLLNDEKELLIRVKNAIDNDEYINITKKYRGSNAFEFARDESKHFTEVVCTECGREASMIDMTNSQYYCLFCTKKK